MRKTAGQLLADPIVEEAELVEKSTQISESRIEIHLKPGVMDSRGGFHGNGRCAIWG